MEIVKSYRYSDQLISCYCSNEEIVVGLWGGKVNFKNKENNSEIKLNIFCTGLFPIANNQYLAITSENKLLEINADRKYKEIDHQESPYLVVGYNLNTQLFMHNTIQQQKYLCLWNMLTQQRQRYEHINNITSLCTSLKGVWIGDSQGYLNYVSESLKLEKRIKLFRQEITQIICIGQQIICSSKYILKEYNKGSITQLFQFDNEISCLNVKDNKLLVGLISGELWIQEKRNNFLQYKIHTSCITNISIYENNIVTSSSDRTAKMVQII